MSAGRRRTPSGKISPVRLLAETESAHPDFGVMLAELLGGAVQGIVVVDTEERIVRVNDQGCRMFGYRPDELIGKKLGKLVPKGFVRAHSAHVAAFLKHPVRRHMGQGRDLLGRRKDGTTFPIEVGLSSVDLEGARLGVAFVSDITERKAVEEKIAIQNEKLRSLTQSLTAAAEAENRKWARELHDVYSQRLVGIAMGLARLSGSGPADPEFEELVSQIRTMAEDVHQLSRRMHPSILHDLGLVAALRAEATAFERESGVRTRFSASGAPDPIPDDVALCLYRVAQETLRNVRKHSNAVRVAISLSWEVERLTLVIEDSGDGFDLDGALRKGGLGLVSMEERVVSVGGEFAVESVPGEGTTVRVVVPLKNRGAPA